ncbi:ATP-binding cassette domain-containing protein [Streptomyces bluensis]|uniref:ATP-binding cassette domain-containing protein n=1 Tax=Streptomyces bluensis TaxID=33897 RepID=UPI003D9EB53A
MNTNTSAPVLRATGVGVRFGGVRALDGVDLTLRPGEVCGLIGPNGAGKTTLFDVLSGIRRPDAGRVLLDGSDITRRSPVWRARHGMRRTFQRQQPFGQLTVADNLVVAQEWRGGGGGLAADLVGAPARRPYERARRDRAAAVLAPAVWTRSPGRTRRPCPSAAPACWSWPARSRTRPGCCSWTSPPPA